MTRAPRSKAHQPCGIMPALHQPLGCCSVLGGSCFYLTIAVTYARPVKEIGAGLQAQSEPHDPPSMVSDGSFECRSLVKTPGSKSFIQAFRAPFENSRVSSGSVLHDLQ